MILTISIAFMLSITISAGWNPILSWMPGTRSEYRIINPSDRIPLPPQETNQKLALVIQPAIICIRLKGDPGAVCFDFDSLQQLGIGAGDYRFRLIWKRDKGSFRCRLNYLPYGPLGENSGRAFRKAVDRVQQSGYGPEVEYDMTFTINTKNRSIIVDKMEFTALTRFPPIQDITGQWVEFRRMGLPSGENFHWLIPYRSSFPVQITLPEEYMKHTKDRA